MKICWICGRKYNSEYDGVCDECWGEYGCYGDEDQGRLYRALSIIRNHEWTEEEWQLFLGSAVLSHIIKEIKDT